METIKRFRFQMLSWLFLPVMVAVLLSNQLIENVNSFNPSSFLSPAPSSSEDQKATNLPQIPDFKYENTGLVTIWFDDAWRSQYDIALPTLDKYGFKAALAVPTRVVGTYNYMDWLQVKRLQHKGWEITAHSRTHNCDMDQAKRAQVDFEVAGSFQDLRIKGLRRDIYVSPCGVHNPLIEEVVKKNYPLGMRTSNPGLNSLPVADRQDITVMAIRKTTTKADVQGWLTQAKNEKKWVILMFHRLDRNVQEYDTDQKHFEEIIAAVKESGLPVVLPSQVLKMPGTGLGGNNNESINQPINETIPKTIVPELPKHSSDDNTTSDSDDSDNTPDPTDAPDPTVAPTPSPSMPSPTPVPTSVPSPNPMPTSVPSGLIEQLL